MPDGTTDEAYLKSLSKGMGKVFDHRPEIIFFLGGADPFEGDKLGRLSLSIEGLRRRDLIVLDEARSRCVPIVTVMSGGYAMDINDTVEIHCNTIRSVRDIFGSDSKQRDCNPGGMTPRASGTVHKFE
jgi:acetoin utilization deacetylase AcuC-like enzyme